MKAQTAPGLEKAREKIFAGEKFPPLSAEGGRERITGAC